MRALDVAGRRGREVDDRARVRRPARQLVVDGVPGDLQRRAAGHETDEDLSAPADARGERDGLRIRRDRRKLLEPAEIRQPVNAGDRVPRRRSATVRGPTHEAGAGGQRHCAATAGPSPRRGTVRDAAARRRSAGARPRAPRGRRRDRGRSETAPPGSFSRQCRRTRCSAGGHADRIGELRRLLAQDRGHRLGGGLAPERRDARQHLVEHDAQAEQVGAMIGAIAARLFRRHVGRGSERPEPVRRQRRRGSRPSPRRRRSAWRARSRES